MAGSPAALSVVRSKSLNPTITICGSHPVIHDGAL